MLLINSTIHYLGYYYLGGVFLRGIKTYHDNNILEKARDRPKIAAMSGSIFLCSACSY